MWEKHGKEKFLALGASCCWTKYNVGTISNAYPFESFSSVEFTAIESSSTCAACGTTCKQCQEITSTAQNHSYCANSTKCSVVVAVNNGNEWHVVAIQRRLAAGLRVVSSSDDPRFLDLPKYAWTPHIYLFVGAFLAVLKACFVLRKFSMDVDVAGFWVGTLWISLASVSATVLALCIWDAEATYNGPGFFASLLFPLSVSSLFMSVNRCLFNFGGVSVSPIVVSVVPLAIGLFLTASPVFFGRHRLLYLFGTILATEGLINLVVVLLWSLLSLRGGGRSTALQMNSIGMVTERDIEMEIMSQPPTESAIMTHAPSVRRYYERQSRNIEYVFPGILVALASLVSCFLLTGFVPPIWNEGQSHLFYASPSAIFTLDLWFLGFTHDAASCGNFVVDRPSHYDPCADVSAATCSLKWNLFPDSLINFVGVGALLVAGNKSARRSVLFICNFVMFGCWFSYWFWLYCRVSRLVNFSERLGRSFGHCANLALSLCIWTNVPPLGLRDLHNFSGYVFALSLLAHFLCWYVHWIAHGTWLHNATYPAFSDHIGDFTVLQMQLYFWCLVLPMTLSTFCRRSMFWLFQRLHMLALPLCVAALVHSWGLFVCLGPALLCDSVWRAWQRHFAQYHADAEVTKDYFGFTRVLVSMRKRSLRDGIGSFQRFSRRPHFVKLCFPRVSQIESHPFSVSRWCAESATFECIVRPQQRWTQRIESGEYIVMGPFAADKCFDYGDNPLIFVGGGGMACVLPCIGATCCCNIFWSVRNVEEVCAFSSGLINAAQVDGANIQLHLYVTRHPDLQLRVIPECLSFLSQLVDLTIFRERIPFNEIIVAGSQRNYSATVVCGPAKFIESARTACKTLKLEPFVYEWV